MKIILPSPIGNYSKEVKERTQQENSEHNFLETEVRNEEISILDGAMKMKLRSTNSRVRIRARLATDLDFDKISEYVRNNGMVRIHIHNFSNKPPHFRNLLGPLLNLMKPVNFLQVVLI